MSHAHGRYLHIARLGDTVAWALCARTPGDVDRGTGWGGALHAAARASDHDPEIVRIADEVFRLAPQLDGLAAVQRYVDATEPGLTGSAAKAFVRGMRAHLEEDG
ncbi:hypothetical protein AB0L40_05990 [Patulibacter sp. NPDC049589]|uniref:hypothetical protein n=1 Tax=Patulibacter sp. NPDC049589 TaxID=3154731 RepID=UPI0034346C29